MKQRAIFTLKPIDSNTGQSQLYCDGVMAVTVLDGVLLEAQFECNGRYLLFTTGDSPFEEMLTIYLLSPSLRILDWIKLGSPYIAGVLENLGASGANSLDFSFFKKQENWRLEIFDRSRWRWGLFKSMLVERPWRAYLRGAYLNLLDTLALKKD